VSMRTIRKGLQADTASGVYCAAVAVALLNLPQDLPRDSPAWSREGDTLFTNLPEWLAKCKSSLFSVVNHVTNVYRSDI
jgi:hypothetical protein